MEKYSEVYVGIDAAKLKHAVAVAEGGRQGEVRFLGEIANEAGAIERLLRKLAARHSKLHVCFEAGPTGYGLYRQVQSLGHDCLVVAPSLIPRRAGERVKTNRRDAVTLARLFRAGELSLPGPRQRDLARAARGAAQGGPRYRLEGAGPTVRQVSSAARRRQEAAGGHRRDRPRDGRLPLGHRSPGRPGNSGLTPRRTTHRCAASGMEQRRGTLAASYVAGPRPTPVL